VSSDGGAATLPPPPQQLSWEMVERTTRAEGTSVDGADVLPILRAEDGSERLVLILNYRPPVDQFVIEMPAGLIDSAELKRAEADASSSATCSSTPSSSSTSSTTTPSSVLETIAEAALRELREETGIRDATVSSCSEVLLVDPWKSNESFCLVTAHARDPGIITSATESAAPAAHALELDSTEMIVPFSIALDASLLSNLEAMTRMKLDAPPPRDRIAMDGKLYTFALGWQLAHQRRG
jgi:8-oxo-dGTP pyrophosphatase MutT (NUDIX family)